MEIPKFCLKGSDAISTKFQKIPDLLNDGPLFSDFSPVPAGNTLALIRSPGSAGCNQSYHPACK
jgi:hypothetical protein